MCSRSRRNIAEAVATADRPAVGHAEQRRILRKPPGSLNAWEEYQRGLWHLAKGSLADDEQALACFRRAAEIDPGFASPFVGSALVYSRSGLYHALRPIAEAGKLGVAGSATGSRHRSDRFRGAGHVGSCTFWHWGLTVNTSLDYAERALVCNRNSASAHWMKASCLGNSGQLLEGRKEALMSLRLNPRDPASAMASSVVTASHFL